MKRKNTSSALVSSCEQKEKDGGSTTTTDTVVFDVGGKIHRTSRSFIMNYQNGDTMLARLISDTWKTKNDQVVDDDASIFIDRNGERFAYVLDFMRYGRLVLPYNVSKELLLLDMDFYGIHVFEQSRTSSGERDCTTLKDQNDETIQYGDAPMGQELVRKLKAEHKCLENQEEEIISKQDAVKSKLFFMDYASLCFSAFTKRQTPFVLPQNEVILEIESWGDGFNHSLYNSLLKKVANTTSEEYLFLNKCLAMYGMGLCGDSSSPATWDCIKVKIIKPHDETHTTTP